MSKLLTLIPDTNLFVQCEALETLDWQRWPNFDEIHVLVTRPVQREIDNHKNKGNDRLSKPARTTSALFRAVIVGSEEFKIIRVDKPTVKLFIRPEIAPSPELEPPLDYSRNDDAIVGTAHAFAKSVGSAATRLLTHDTGPMATAKMLGFPSRSSQMSGCSSLKITKRRAHSIAHWQKINAFARPNQSSKFVASTVTPAPPSASNLNAASSNRLCTNMSWRSWPR